MSRAAWAAIIAAIAFPTVALVVVLFAGPRPPPVPPHPPAPPGDVRAAPPLPHVGGPPPGGLREEMLVRLRGKLGLSDEQVDRIWNEADRTRRRMIEIETLLEEKEGALRDLLESESPDESAVEESIDEVNRLHAEQRKLAVLTPLRMRNILTSEQRTQLVEIWRERGMGAPDGGPELPGSRGRPPAAPWAAKGPPPGGWGTKGPPPGGWSPEGPPPPPGGWGTKGPPPPPPGGWGTKGPPPPPPGGWGTKAPPPRAGDLENPFAPPRGTSAPGEPRLMDPFTARVR